MNKGRIIVVPYCEQWPREFDKIRSGLAAALGDTALSIEHVGSTSVPGLWAKPIIDVDVVINDSAALPEAISRLQTAGYHHEGDLGVTGREAFKYSNKPELMTHHLYVCPQDSPELARHIRFRDYLRGHPDAALEYSRVKREGAELFPDDIDGYISHKCGFIEEIYRLAGL